LKTSSEILSRAELLTLR